MKGDFSIDIDLEQPPLIDQISSYSSLEPCNGMKFKSKEDAFSFYKEYANSVGFTPIIKASRRSRISGKFIDAKFVCSRYGLKPDQSVKKKRGRTNQSKTDCKAFIHVKIRQDDEQIWEIHSFFNDHNHDLYLSLDCIKSRTRVKQKELMFDKEDLSVLLEHLMFMQEENPNFFYAVDLDEEQRLRNVMWVDAKARVDCECFDDVVLFDNSYVKNAYKLPLVLFIGVNHHSQLMILGCGLIWHETKSAYKWVMQAWLRGVHLRFPKVFLLTEFDQCSIEAADEVFVDSCHCYSLSHILSRVSEKLGYVIRQHQDFITKFNECVFWASTEKDFENRWREMVDEFGLSNDEWIQSLFDDRVRWIPCYSNFSGIMWSTKQHQRLDIIQRKTTLKEFIGQYKSILSQKLEEESKADFETFHKQPGLKSPSPFGKQMATIYTHSIFKKFQVEVLGVVACHPKRDCSSSSRFNVQDFEANREFNVVWNETTSDVSCSCRFFQYNGFLCRHVMIILQICGVNAIPSRYILKRWTKDAKKGRSSIKGESCLVDQSRFGRYNRLVRQAFRLGDEGSSSEESYNIALAALEEGLRKCGDRNKSDSDQPEAGIWQQHAEQMMDNTRAMTDDGYFVGQQHFNQNLGQFSEDYHTNQQSMSGLILHNG
ncbi:protein FAR-RED IMPAIRED RESPONSE 1 [Impatiens glandulifera]|uniref:protein FAR-RED IMPAIRED RESPONSE 1 n=1 Tax=Impatiens glandulifera TaxID=253017 RepID=UPI001FB13496|nr:protein FAR-RED IMPAIRED RESPONSE 1 [Impatiens glandulifera]